MYVGAIEYVVANYIVYVPALNKVVLLLLISVIYCGTVVLGLRIT